ncbi:MAG TPA: ATP-binding cassette domain-containing protein [Herpetosiphonaceae bacterium]|nr:ATP-binding cassette domain-containing protein [Herpetosiphonaceae bacterium]
MLEDVYKYFRRDIPTLRGVNLTVERGEFVFVTGPSGAGKTTIVPHLQALLPDWDVFETDILSDSGGDWAVIKHNWLRVAAFLARAGRPCVLCGTMQPDQLSGCPEYDLFGAVHWLALACDPAALAGRLAARPAWRGCDPAFIREHQAYLGWFRDQAAAPDPPLALLDTTAAAPEETARQIKAWIDGRWPEANR